MGFRYKKMRTPSPPRVEALSQTGGDDEVLTGEVQGQNASDLEERFARALENVGVSFRFQMPVQTAHSLRGQEKNVDFLLYSGERQYPVEVYGPYFHETSAHRLKDEERERELNDAFQKMGLEKLQIVWYYHLYDQEIANEAARRLLL